MVAFDLAIKVDAGQPGQVFWEAPEVGGACENVGLAFYGGGISFIGAPGGQGSARAVDPAMPVHGPFSADFKWVTLPGEEGRPILCTDGQAAVFRALWSFKGEPRTAEQVMGRAQLASQKPIDVFKGKKHAEPLRAYRTLVVTQQRAGLYSMPCAAASSFAPA